MQTNKGPDKIYIQPNAHDGWFVNNNLNGTFIEYANTDVFIEKALRWMISQCGVNDALSREMIEKFKQYMKE